MADACGSCRFFEVIVAYGDPSDGATAEPDSICRRFPPIDGWSSVLADDWCGEFQAEAADV